MKLLLSASLFALLLLCGSSSTRADQLRLTLQGVNGAHQGGYYVGPNNGLLSNLTTGKSSPVAIVCDDFAHAVTIGSSWGVNSFTFDQHMSARFGSQTNAHDKYLAAFWLTDQFNSAPEDQWGNIQYAIWGLFNSKSKFSTVSARSLRNQAFANIGNVDPSRFRILTPTGANVGQEMITTVPEPVSMLLFGSGLAGSAMAVRRRRKREQQN